MLDLELYDIVRIEKSNGIDYLESVNEISPQACIGGTDHFDINYSTLEVQSNPLDETEGYEYTLTNVWRPDKKGNYKLIWVNGKEIEDDKPNQCDCRPADVSWEEHHKTLVENAELKDIIVELNKEINAMKKGYTK